MACRDVVVSSSYRWDDYYLDDISCNPYYMIIGILLEHSSIYRSKELDLMVTKFGVGMGHAQKEILDTKGCHARFTILKKN